MQSNHLYLITIICLLCGVFQAYDSDFTSLFSPGFILGMLSTPWQLVTHCYAPAIALIFPLGYNFMQRALH